MESTTQDARLSEVDAVIGSGEGATPVVVEVVCVTVNAVMAASVVVVVVVSIRCAVVAVVVVVVFNVVEEEQDVVMVVPFNRLSSELDFVLDAATMVASAIDTEDDDMISAGLGQEAGSAQDSLTE